MQRTFYLRCSVLATALAAIATNRGEDWPTWRGPNRDGRSNEKAQLEGWPKEGPPVIWRAQVGPGCSSVTIADGRAFTMGHITEDEVGKDVMYCLDAATGKELWRFAYPQPLEPLGFVGGPCITPCVEGDRVYTVNKRKRAFCFDVKTGKLIWDTNPAEVVDPKNQKTMLLYGGHTASPFIHEDLLITGFGGLEKTTGKPRWTFKRTAKNATPLPCLLGGKKCVILFCDGLKTGGVAAARLDDGQELWHVPLGVNTVIADPILIGDRVFVSWRASTDPTIKCAVLKIGPDGAEVVWRNGAVSSYLHEFVLWEGHLYGCDEKAGLSCLDFQTGELKWSEKKMQRCQASLVDGKLLLQSANALIVADPSPEGYRPLNQMAMKAGGMPAPPVLANGKLFCRTTAGEVICLDVTRK